jgi:glucose/arabinose dehydrogenase
VQNGRVIKQEPLVITSRARRIRDVREGRDGFLYVLAESGELLRIEPAS